jgi:hypothetical protein
VSAHENKPTNGHKSLQNKGIHIFAIVRSLENSDGYFLAFLFIFNSEGNSSKYLYPLGTASHSATLEKMYRMHPTSPMIRCAFIPLHHSAFVPTAPSIRSPDSKNEKKKCWLNSLCPGHSRPLSPFAALAIILV